MDMNHILSVSIRRGVAVAVFAIAAVLGGAGAAAASAAPAPYCGITWGSLPRDSAVSSTAPLTNVRTGQHDCFDRVVFDFRGSAAGYSVLYADQVLGQARGDVLPVAGGARLSVGLVAPAYDIATGAPTYDHATGDHVADVAGFRTLRDVVYGGSFEGHTTFGVGVRARLPFRVFTLAGPDGGSRIVIDVAHRWSR
jgi:hypothetical protein